MKIMLHSSGHAKLLSNFYLENSAHLKQWEPRRENNYHSVSSWLNRLKEREIEQEEGRAAYFLSYDPLNDKIIAICSLTNIIQGPFKACYIGYAISHLYEGKGKMKSLCQYVINYAFNELQLNRIMANYMPNNIRSESLLNQLGFLKEGYASSYLLINGKWEDHILTSLINQKS